MKTLVKDLHNNVYTVFFRSDGMVSIFGTASTKHVKLSEYNQMIDFQLLTPLK